MTEINSQNTYTPQVSDTSNSNNTNEADNNLKVDTEAIDSIFVTTKQEDKRTTFDESFKELGVDKRQAKQGREFLAGLEQHKEAICEAYNMDSEEYDALSCVALALASQETGMGHEFGYQTENTGLIGLGRKVVKYVDSKLGHGSASSGLTQLKIHDFIEGASDDTKKLLDELGVSDSGPSVNNLYSERDKSAAATMVMLSEIVTNNYTQYKEVLSKNHDEVRKELDPSLSDSECIKEGILKLDSIRGVYDTLDAPKQEELRVAMKQWMLSYNGSLDNEQYLKDHPNDKAKDFNEEFQLNKINEILGGSLTLKQDDLNYIRYALSSDNASMNITEYCAYAWNKGTGETGMQFDRMLAEKIGTLFANPEDFDYDQFSVNVASLTDKYAQQANADLNVVNILLEEFARRKSI